MFHSGCTSVCWTKTSFAHGCCCGCLRSRSFSSFSSYELLTEFKFWNYRSTNWCLASSLQPNSRQYPCFSFFFFFFFYHKLKAWGHKDKTNQTLRTLTDKLTHTQTHTHTHTQHFKVTKIIISSNIVICLQRLHTGQHTLTFYMIGKKGLLSSFVFISEMEHKWAFKHCSTLIKRSLVG